MKKLVKVEEVEGEGLIGLMGQRITLFCSAYIYTGKLVGVNESFVMLEDAGIVYNTGAFNVPKWEDYQAFPTKNWYVTTASVESFGILK